MTTVSGSRCGATLDRLRVAGFALSTSDGKPRVAIVMRSWGKAEPPPPYWAEILKALDELGLRTEVIAAELHPRASQEQPPPGRRAFLLSLAFVPALLRSSAPVLFCIEYSVATALCVVLARVRGKRTIIFQEHYGRQGLRLSRWEAEYRRLLGTLANALVANTDAAYVELTEVLRLDPRKVHRATLLVPPERAALSREPGFVPETSRRPVFLFVGQLVKRKNVGGLLDAASALRARGFEFEVWIVGDGPERSRVETQAADLIAERVVRFLGSRSNSTIGTLLSASAKPTTARVANATASRIPRPFPRRADPPMCRSSGFARANWATISRVPSSPSAATMIS